MNDERGFWIFFAFCALVALAFATGAVIVAVHFLAKWW